MVQIIFFSNLSWKSNIEYIALKISKTVHVGITSKIRHFVPFQALIFQSLISPYITCVTTCTSMQGEEGKRNIPSRLMLQKPEKAPA